MSLPSSLLHRARAFVTLRNTTSQQSKLPILTLLLMVVSIVALPRLGFAQWTELGPYGKNIHALTQAPDNPNIMFAGSFGWGTFSSFDNGATWVNHRLGLTNSFVRAIKARSSAVIVCGSNDNIARSADSGATWVVVQTTLKSVRSIDWDPVTGKWYAGTFGDDLYVSSNDGVNWTKVIVSDPISLQTLHKIRSVRVFGVDSVYAAGSITSITTGGALFRSVNGGLSWTQVQQGIGVRSTVNSVSVSPNSPATSYIFGTAANGMYKSTTGGLTTIQINADSTLNPLPDLDISTTGFTGAYRMAGSNTLGNLYLRHLGDTTIGWIGASGLPGGNATPKAILDAGGGARIIAGLKEEGAYVSNDSGLSYSPLSQSLLRTAVRGIAFTSTGRVVAGLGFGDKIFHSDNFGTSWVRDSLGSFNSIFDVEKATNGDLYAAQYGTGVLKSSDNGTTWSQADTLVINRFVRAVAPDPFNSLVVYAGTGNGVFKTTNGGLSWADAKGGVIPFSTSIRSLKASPLTSGLILAGTDVDFLYRSANGGLTWSHVTSANGFASQDVFVRSIGFDPVAANVAYIGSDSGHVYKSVDAGANWSFLVDLPTVNSVRRILVNPANTSNIFVATFGGGVFVTEDGGATWYAYNDPLVSLKVYTIEIRPGTNPPELWVGTRWGAWKQVFTGPPADIFPVISGPASSCVTAGSMITLDYTATDQNTNDILQFSLVGPGSVTWTPSTSPNSVTYQWLTTSGDVAGSPYTVDIIVDDGAGGLDTALVDLTVVDPANPTGCSCCAVAGDADHNARFNIADVTFMINRIFSGGPAPACNDEADANGTNSFNIADVTYSIARIFSGGPAPVCGTTGS